MLKIYLFILAYFILGGIGFYFINRKKDWQQSRENWLKFITYFVIINVIFLTLAYFPVLFAYLGILIVLVGAGEMLRLFISSGKQQKGFFVLAMIIYVLLSGFFISFTMLGQKITLFTFLLLSIFDAFSQISGQLAGKHRLAPGISPGKTVEGLIGGILLTLVSSVFLRVVIDLDVNTTILLALAVLIAAFGGDMAASLYKRKYDVKDFSSLLPGHGGFLDRFDSLIAGGALVAVLKITGVI